MCLIRSRTRDRHRSDRLNEFWSRFCNQRGCSSKSRRTKFLNAARYSHISQAGNKDASSLVGFKSLDPRGPFTTASFECRLHPIGEGGKPRLRETQILKFAFTRQSTHDRVLH